MKPPKPFAFSRAAGRALARYQRAIERALRRALPIPLRQEPRVLHQAMRYSLMSGGKRIRPVLCLAGCEAVGGRLDEALSAACGIELIHTYSLIHDDLPAMDDAATRRGRASCHRRFGEDVAILAGDALLTQAFALLASGHRQTVHLRVVREMARASGTAGLIGGQVADTAVNGHATVNQLQYIAAHKTGALIRASMRIGALLGGASPKQLAPLDRYGQAIGLAFQLVDDVLDQDGFVRAIGAAKTRQAAAQQEHRAHAALATLAARGEPAQRARQLLNELAAFIAQRTQ